MDPRLSHRPHGGSSDLIIAGSTLAAAAVFNPIRRRIQGRVDSRLNRARYDADQALLTKELGSTATFDKVSDILTRLVSRTVQPVAVALGVQEWP